ncbi:recombination regulator RecX [Peribacillus loiseleuriae]|uniref:recombination regulator RecX n=1 Tax=Peribacillus loiseleuriae TaxID=1679170 RepID=UPI0037F88C0F
MVFLAVITKITTQQKRTDRYNIFMDYGKGKGEEYAFSVDEEVLLKFQLKKGMEINEYDLADIKLYDEIQKSFTSALNYLSHRMRSEQEIRIYLKKKEIDEPIIQETVLKLYKYKYLDDLEFARAFVRTYMNGGNKGPIIIQQELREKGVKLSIIEQAMVEYPSEQQIEHAVMMAEKAIKKETKLSERALKQKLDQILSRKGFTRDVISIALQEVTLEKDDDEEWRSLMFQAEKIKRRYQGYTGYEYEQRMKQALFRKGFAIEMIDRYLSDEEQE